MGDLELAVLILAILAVAWLLVCHCMSVKEGLVANENQHLTSLDPALLVPSTASGLVTSEVPSGKREVMSDELALRLYAGL